MNKLREKYKKWNESSKSSKVWKWMYTILCGVFALCAIVFIQKGTSDNFPYDEKAYLIALCILSVVMFFEMYHTVENKTKEEKERKDKEAKK